MRYFSLTLIADLLHLTWIRIASYNVLKGTVPQKNKGIQADSIYTLIDSSTFEVHKSFYQSTAENTTKKFFSNIFSPLNK